MKPSLTSLLTLRRSAVIALVALSLTGAMRPSARAVDVVWNNMAGNFLWNTTELNWSTGAWNNAAGNGALFGPAAAGTLNLTEAINVNSLNFTGGNYTLGGVGPLTFVNGTSTLGTGFINTATGVTATINTAINSSLGLIKLGEGTLQLAGPLNFSGDGFALLPRGVLPSDIIVGGGSSSGISGGTIRIMNNSVLPATTRVGISDGLFDIGANNVTIAALNFTNQSNGLIPFNPAIGSAEVGLIGTGTLRVTGDINVVGVNTGNFGSNTIATNLDLGGGTQIVRTAGNGNFISFRALQFTGVLSNGSLLKTFGYTENGIMGNPDGMALFGNNTYTGSTTLNGGDTIMTGTNATSSVRIVGDRGPFAPNGTTLTLQGANGSLLGATTIQAVAGGIFIIDNSSLSDLPAGGDYPTTPAAQNNNRLRDDAEIQLRDAQFTYRGRANTAASETFGNLNLLGGTNLLNITTSGTGSVALTASGNLTLAPRSALLINSAVLGGVSRVFINGTMPAADATGILRGIIQANSGAANFVTYNGATGVTPFSSYATDFSTPGTNVSVSASSAVASSVDINALKRTTGVTTTIGAGQTLGITSGMIIQQSGTGTFTGGTLAFGAAPGMFFGGTGSATNVVNSAITGSSGLINTNSTLTLNGDLSGLTGIITTQGAGTTNLATNTFGGSLEVRFGTLNLNTSQTLAGQGAITLGVPENDDHLINNFASINFSGAGAGAIIGRDIIVDHGSFDAAGIQTTFGFLPSLAPLSNTTGSQTLSGNITLNSPVRLQGGGGTSGTGFTTLSGNISGPAQFYLSNGRVTLSGNYSNAGGFRVGEGGFTSQATFTGTATGSAPIVIEGGNSTFIAYNANSLPTGTITVEGTNASGTGTTASINPLQNSTINNVINLSSTVLSNVTTGVTGNWNGVVSGAGGLVKSGTGTLVLGNANNTYTGATTVSAGTLLVNGASASATTTVANTGTLGGNGNIGGSVTVNAGGTIAPGNSIGTFATGSLSLAGTFLAEINLNNGGAASADLLNLTGSFNIAGGTLALSLSNLPGNLAPGTYLLVANDGSDAITGTFSSITGLPGGITATVDYAFNGTDSLGRVGNGNDLAVNVVPEPATYGLIAMGLGSMLLLRRRRRA